MSTLVEAAVGSHLNIVAARRSSAPVCAHTCAAAHAAGWRPCRRPPGLHVAAPVDWHVPAQSGIQDVIQLSDMLAVVSTSPWSVAFVDTKLISM